MSDNPSYKSAIAAAEAQRIAESDQLHARLATPIRMFNEVVDRYIGRLRDLSEVLQRASSATPHFSAWQHNDKQRVYTVDAVQQGRLVFRLVHPQADGDFTERGITSLQIFDPYRDPERKGALNSVPAWDRRPEDKRYSRPTENSPGSFAILIPWIQSYEFQISLRARLGEALSAERIEDLKHSAVTPILSGAEPHRRMAVFLDDQAHEAMTFCEHVLESMLEYMASTAERATKHLEKVAQPPARRARTKSQTSTFLVNVIVLAGVAAVAYFLWSWLN